MITYNFFGSDYRLVKGMESVFQSLKYIIGNHMANGGTYYHFVGHPDNTWNEEGMTDRARRDIVPIKVAKQLRTIGLYYPSDWLLSKFGGDAAKAENRNMNFLPDGVEVPIRFYCCDSNVFYILETGSDFEAVDITDCFFRAMHARVVQSLIANKIPSPFFGDKCHLTCQFGSRFYESFDDKSGYPNPNDRRNLLMKAVSSLAYLDLIAKGYKYVTVEDEELKKHLSALKEKSKGIELIIQ